MALAETSSKQQKKTTWSPLLLHHTYPGKTADEKYHPFTSPHAEIHLESGGVTRYVYPGCSLFKPTLLEPPKLASRTI